MIDKTDDATSEHGDDPEETLAVVDVGDCYSHVHEEGCTNKSIAVIFTLLGFGL
jgi:hypothetical protein